MRGVTRSGWDVARLPLVDGSNAFQVIAGDLHGDSMTNQYAANLPVNTRLTFDLNGNTISDGMRRFDYDDFNELIRVTATNSWKTEYDYDGLMRRHERRDFVWLNSAWQLRNTCYYVYAGGMVVEEVATTTNAPVVYVYGVGLLAREQSNTVAFYRLDGNGNVTGLFDSNDGMLAQYRYDPYGNLIAKSGPLADVNRYRFASQEFDPQTGLYAYLYRFYEPDSQRWLNQDPIQEWGGINLYRAMNNNPLNEIDPYGLYGWSDYTRDYGTGWQMVKDAGTWTKQLFTGKPGDMMPQDGYNGYRAGTGMVTPLPGNIDPGDLMFDLGTLPLMAAVMGPEREGADLLAGAAKCEKIAQKGKSVIGPRAVYEDFAKKIGANYLPSKGWNELKNLNYIFGVIERGDDVYFAGRFDPARLDPNSVLAQEIAILIKYGYRWTADGTKLIKQ